MGMPVFVSDGSGCNALYLRGIDWVGVLACLPPTWAEYACISREVDVAGVNCQPSMSRTGVTRRRFR